MSKNDITGDKLVSKPSTDKYAEGHDRIWGKKKAIAKEALEMVYAVSLETVAPSTYMEPKPPPGYTAEELELDNPYNQWMYENKDLSED